MKTVNRCKYCGSKLTAVVIKWVPKMNRFKACITCQVCKAHGPKLGVWFDNQDSAIEKAVELWNNIRVRWEDES